VRHRRILVLLGLMMAGTASASDEAPQDAADLPIPTMKLNRINPTVSYEMGAQFSFGTVTYWRDYVPAWIGMGLRGGWGKNLGNHRLGLDVTLTAEGPFGVHTSVFMEPVATWYLITDQNLLVGAGVGPALMYHVRNDVLASERSFGVAPSASLRVGWSQSWTRVGRRVFVFVEPKMRVIDGKLNPLVALVFGSGAGK
jgi:hypothetical protein